MNEQIVKYETGYGEITLSPNIVKKYLVSGAGNITEQEIMMFLALCKYQKLNPFLREVYLIKYGAEKATIVTGKETFLKRAYRNPKYQGHETGVSEDGQIAWAKVYMKGYQVPIKCEVDYEEYVGVKRDGTPNRMWAEKPRTMLKKVALVQALREALPEDLGGLYSQEEIPSVGELSIDPVVMNAETEQKTDAKKEVLKEKLKKQKRFILEKEKPATTESFVLCPERKNDQVLKSFCNNECEDREGCPAWEDEDRAAQTKTAQASPKSESALSEEIGRAKMIADNFVAHIKTDIKSEKHLNNWIRNNKEKIEEIMAVDPESGGRIEEAIEVKKEKLGIEPGTSLI